MLEKKRCKRLEQFKNIIHVTILRHNKSTNMLHKISISLLDIQ